MPNPNSDEPEITRLVTEHRIFKGLAPRYAALLAEVAMLKEISENEIIFREGDPANRFYLILEGEVVLESVNGDTAVKLQTIERDDVLGWSWLFPPYYWHFDARATQSTRAIFFYGTWLRENCERDHEFGYEMLTRFVPVVIDRLQAARRQFVKIQNSRA
jgi:CRP/FNR family transcriptional regulator, cyclic AMP receptor protein